MIIKKENEEYIIDRKGNTKNIKNEKKVELPSKSQKWVKETLGYDHNVLNRVSRQTLHSRIIETWCVFTSNEISHT